MKFIQIEENVWGYIKRYTSFYVLVDTDDKLIFIDTGLKIFSRRRIDKVLSVLEKSVDDIKAVLITHADGDHIGGLQYISKRNDSISIYASEKTAEYLRNQKCPPHYGFMYNVLKVIYKYSFKQIVVDKIVKEGDVIDMFNGIRVFESSGHSDDDLSYSIYSNKIIFVGDLLQFMNGKIKKSPLAMSMDYEKVEKNYSKILDLKPKIICSGHCDDVYLVARDRP